VIEINRDDFSQEFHDMRLRVMNSRPCPIVFWASGKPESWTYGTLYASRENDMPNVTFGDLTISVSPREFMILVDIAANPDSEYAWQW